MTRSLSDRIKRTHVCMARVAVSCCVQHNLSRDKVARMTAVSVHVLKTYMKSSSKSSAVSYFAATSLLLVMASVSKQFL